MHELSIVQGIIRIIDDQQKVSSFFKVNSIELVCGKYNCLSEENIQFCYNALAESSCLKGASVQVVRVTQPLYCRDCSHEFSDRDLSREACPLCDSHDIVQLKENAIFVSKLEVD